MVSGFQFPVSGFRFLVSGFWKIGFLGRAVPAKVSLWQQPFSLF
jgi:hypothetical protein